MAAGLLWVLLARASGLGLASAIDGPAALAYRLAFWLALPAEVLLRAVAPFEGHHAPGWHAPVESVVTALAGLAVLRLGRRLRAMRSALRERREGPASPGRRAALERLVAGSAGAALSGLGLYATAVEPARLAVRRYERAIRGLPPWAEGLRLLHVSDTHYGPFVSIGFLEAMVDGANALRPDLALLTGDYVHRTAAAIEPGIEVLGRLRARLGSVAVLGNHDHWEGADRVRAALGRAGVRLVENRRLFLGPEGLEAEPAGEERICVAGVEDLWEGAPLPEVALRGVPAGMPRLLLSHNPDLAEALGPELRVDLMLSGHTHGGQVALPGLGAPAVPSAYGSKYVGGLCRGPTCPVLVSRGVGMAILPVRLSVRPEIGLVTLRSA